MNTEEKSLAVISEDNIFKKVRKFFRKLFFKEKEIVITAAATYTNEIEDISVQYIHEKSNILKNEPYSKKSIFKEKYIIPEPMKNRDMESVQVDNRLEYIHSDETNVVLINEVRFGKIRTIKLHNRVFGKFIDLDNKSKVIFLEEKILNGKKINNAIKDKETENQLIRRYNVLDTGAATI